MFAYSEPLTKGNSTMKNAIYVMLALMIGSLFACDEGETFPPEICAALKDIEVFINESELVALCFTDPDGDAITVSVVASDPNVVDVSVQGGSRAIALRGLVVGESSVTVIATDATGKMAEAIFMVEVPNRVPELELELPEITLTDASPTASLTLTDYFSDPDDHPLIFTAVSSDESVVRVMVEGNTIEFLLEGNGSAQVQVTASDPAGGEISDVTIVVIRITAVLLRDDFDIGLESSWLSDDHTVASIVDGRLQITATEAGYFAQMERILERSENWQVSTEVEFATNDMWPALWFVENDVPGQVRLVAVIIGADVRRMVSGSSEDIPESNIAVVFYDDENLFRTNLDWNVMVDGVPGPNERARVTVKMGSDGMKILIDDLEVHKIPVVSGDLTLPSSMVRVGLLAWPPLGIETIDGSELTYFEFVEVIGTPVGESTAQAVAPSIFARPSAVRMIK